MNYLIQEGNAKSPMQFITNIAKQSQKHEEALMTITQQIEQMGVEKGMQQGILKGKLEGKLEGIQEGLLKDKLEGEKQASMKIARQMLEDGMDRQAVMKFTGLTEKDLSQLFVN